MVVYHNFYECRVLKPALISHTFRLYDESSRTLFKAS